MHCQLPSVILYKKIYWKTYALWGLMCMNLAKLSMAWPTLGSCIPQLKGHSAQTTVLAKMFSSTVKNLSNQMARVHTVFYLTRISVSTLPYSSCCAVLWRFALPRFAQTHQLLGHRLLGHRLLGNTKTDRHRQTQTDRQT